MANNAGVVLALPGKITVEKCSVLKGKLEKVKDAYQSMMLDFRKVEDLDLAGMQLLSAFFLDCSSAKKEIGCLGPLKDRVRKGLVTSGLLSASEEGDFLFPFFSDKGVKIELGR